MRPIVYLLVLLLMVSACSQPEAVIIDLPPPPSCPESCDDGDACTLDSCSAATDFECSHSPQACCGDGTCQGNENECTCEEDCGICKGEAALGLVYACVDDQCQLTRPEDLPEQGSLIDDSIDCDDDNICTEDVLVDGECEYELLELCCGNDDCEQGESCESCYQDCACILDKDLSDFPNIFSEDPLIITGDDAPAIDQLSATLIATAVLSSGNAVLASEVSSIQGRDVIVVGSSCVNRFARQLAGNPRPCDALISDAYADIILVPNGEGSVALLVKSKDPALTRVAATVLKNHRDYSLSGTSIRVKGTLDDPRVLS
ncbi:MAG: hypothetical protein ABIH34_04450 [Nanoarchaeota archaeon]